jgi:hypothetical protein
MAADTPESLLREVLEHYLPLRDHCWDSGATPPESCKTCVYSQRWDDMKADDTPCEKFIADRIRKVLEASDGS